jgi:hypothetical protein
MEGKANMKPQKLCNEAVEIIKRETDSLSKMVLHATPATVDMQRIDWAMKAQHALGHIRHAAGLVAEASHLIERAEQALAANRGKGLRRVERRGWWRRLLDTLDD